jgi:hypothetical protein
MHDARPYSRLMKYRLLLCCVLTASIAACQAPYKKKDDEDKKPLKDQSGDQAFQSVLGRLRLAIARRDHATISSLMAPDFGYRWDTPPPGETAFQYWDQHGLWGQLSETVNQKFAAHETFMVAPPQVATDPTYAGYRAGMRIVGGSWRFAYFVPAAPAQ